MVGVALQHLRNRQSQCDTTYASSVCVSAALIIMGEILGVDRVLAFCAFHRTKHLVGGIFFFLMHVLVNNQSKKNDVFQAALFCVAQFPFSINLCFVSETIWSLSLHSCIKKKKTFPQISHINCEFLQKWCVLFCWAAQCSFQMIKNQYVRHTEAQQLFPYSLSMVRATIWPDVSIM